MSKDLLRFTLNKKKVLVFDAETESLNLAASRPYQMGWILFENGEITDQQNRYLDWPDFKISKGAARASKFDYGVWHDNKEDSKKVANEFSKLLFNKEIIAVGHNILGFDIYQVKNWFNQTGVDYNYSYLSRCLDTNCLAKAIAKEIPVPKKDFLEWQFKLMNFRERGLKTNLTQLCKNYNIELDESKFHDAVYDVFQTFEVLKKQMWEIEI